MTSTSTLALTQRLHIGDLDTPVTINIWRDDEDGCFSATSSHAIKTPLQASPDVPQPGGHHQETAEDAAETVARLYRAEYTTAVEAGHQPSESWLVTMSA